MSDTPPSFNALSDRDKRPGQPRRAWVQLLLFLGTFGLLQWGWESARGTALESLLVDDVTVKLTAALINCITPGMDALPRGSTIAAPGGGLHILRGCEGLEILFLLMAALTSYPMAWRVRLTGMGVGALLIFALNEMRLLALFYSHRHDRALFDQLHGLVTPLLMVAAVVLFFMALMRWQERTAPVHA